MPDAPIARVELPRRREPTAVVEYDDETVDVRAWARTYVNILLSLEGIALVPAPITCPITEPIKRAS